MTGGTALPADISKPPAPGSPQPGGEYNLHSSDQPGQQEPGSSRQEPGSSRQEPGSRLPGLPRLYFPEQADQPSPLAGQPGQPQGQPGPRADQPYGQPGQPGQPGPSTGRSYGQLGQPQGLPDQPRNRPGTGMFRRRPMRQPTGQRPARQRPTRPPERELRHRAIASLIFGALSLVALVGLGSNLRRGVYLLIFSATIGVAACVIGITALRKARRTGAYRPRGAVGGIVLGAFAALLSIPILTTYLIFPTQVDNYVKCLSLAQTSSDQHACENQFYKSIQ